MPKIVGQECGTCKFWQHQIGGSPDIGYCKYDPPFPMFGSHFQQAGSGKPELSYNCPLTTSADWCGRWIKT